MVVIAKNTIEDFVLGSVERSPNIPYLACLLRMG